MEFCRVCEMIWSSCGSLFTLFVSEVLSVDWVVRALKPAAPLRHSQQPNALSEVRYDDTDYCLLAPTVELSMQMKARQPIVSTPP